MFREGRQIIICVVAVVMVAGFVLFWYLPLQKKKGTIEQERAAQRLAIGKAFSESEQLGGLKEQLVELQRAVENYERQVSDRRDLGVFLQQLTNLMNEQNLKEQVIAPGEEIQTEGLHCILVSMQCKGKLKQLFEFYKQMRKLDRLVRIEQVKFVNESDFGGEVSMQTKAHIYYRPEGVKG